MAGILHMLNGPLGGAGGLVFVIDTADTNIKTLLIANGWDGTSVIHPTVVIQSTAKLYASSTGTYALDTGSGWPVGCTLTIVNNGLILGHGGAGANSGTSNHGLPGGNGGNAIHIQLPTNITNSGVIGGGGGGGGSGGTTYGGGGGGGEGNGPGGTSLHAYYGGTATLTAYGAGGSGLGFPAGFYPGYGGTGGNGGIYGSPGDNGALSYESHANVYYPGGTGGAPGAAVVGNSLVTWVTNGTIYGNLV